MIVATGDHKGRSVSVTWSPGQPLAGPSAAVLALIDFAADLTGTEIGVPTRESIDSDYLEFESGFRYVAHKVLDECSFHYPEGEQEAVDDTDDEEGWIN